MGKKLGATIATPCRVSHYSQVLSSREQSHLSISGGEGDSSHIPASSVLVQYSVPHWGREGGSINRVPICRKVEDAPASFLMKCSLGQSHAPTLSCCILQGHCILPMPPPTCSLGLFQDRRPVSGKNPRIARTVGVHLGPGT